jgi:hypothetical protein
VGEASAGLTPRNGQRTPQWVYNQPMSRPYLSKSKYLVGLQCPKLLWTHYNAREQLPPPDAQTQAVFSQGHEVGRLAQGMYPGGIAVGEELSIEAVIEQSQDLVKKRQPLFEAGFSRDRAYARLDVLNPVRGGKWELVEVKSGTSVKDPNWDDVAFQKYCCEGAGVAITRCHVMHVDGSYVRRGAVDPSRLFVKEDVTEAVTEKATGLEDRLSEMLQTIELRMCPHVDIGPHCDAVYGCPLKDACWKDVNKKENNVFTLTRLGAKAWPLFEKGIVTNNAIPGDVRLSKTQQIQVTAEKTGKPHIDSAAAKAFLNGLVYPLYLLDFETFQTAVPLVDGTRPYQQVPFQFSLHVAKTRTAKPRHHSWLWNGAGDPRRELLDALAPLLGSSGSVVVFNAAFEKTRLQECVDAHPGFSSWLEPVLERVADLLTPFRSFDVYYPSQHGSASIKAVLPALTGKTYQDLAIHDGGQASDEFKKVTFGDATERERQKVRRNLEEYCGLDTMGMLDIINALAALASRRPSLRAGSTATRRRS